jgi:hypothetical protein
MKPSYIQYNKNGQEILFNPETEKLYFTNPTGSNFRFTLHYPYQTLESKI